MHFVYFLLFSITVFLLALVGYKKYRVTTLYALAIGGVVNANFFHAANYPVDCFGLPFGIDSVIYTLFAFCVIVMFLKEDKRLAYLLAFSGIVAILFSAAMQLVADLFSENDWLQAWKTFLSFFISAIASILAVIATLETLEKLRGKINEYWCLIIGILIVTVINGGLYYPLSVLINTSPENLPVLLFTSFIGKCIALLCGLFTLFLLNKMERRQLKTQGKREE